MSFRPPFPNTNNAFPSFNINRNMENISIVPRTNTDAFQGNFHYVNSSHINRYPLSTPSAVGITTNINERNRISNNAPLFRPPFNAPPLSTPGAVGITTTNINERNRVSNNAPLSRSPFSAPPLSNPNLVNSGPHDLVNFASRPSNVNSSSHPLHEQSYNRNTASPIIANSNNTNFNFEPRTVPVQRFPSPMSNVTCNNLQPNINYHPRFQNNSCFNSSGNAPTNLSNVPQFPAPGNQSTANILSSPASYSVRNTINPIPQPTIYTNPLTARPIVVNSYQDVSVTQQNISDVQMPLKLQPNDTSKLKNSNISLNPLIRDKEIKVSAFLEEFSTKKKEMKRQVTIPEFRYVVKAAIRMIQLLNEKKNKLSKLLDASESEWKSEVEIVLNDQEELSSLCTFISAPDHLNNVIGKLKLIKKRREKKKKTKQNKLSEKIKAEQKRKERHQEIDKWLDDIKEKNQKIKREAELKKEADYILLEVRRKIYEAKKTIDKLKVFEKLRNARQANAAQKGLHVLSMHNTKFEKKVTILKETMLKQLADYEAEEKALKVMLETEQEGQREEEAQWKIKKMKTLQKKKQNYITECLFDTSDDPLPIDPLYLFYKYHTSATSSAENVVQIRQQWDIHIAENGEVIPQHWVVPVAPSNASWEQCLATSNN